MIKEIALERGSVVSVSATRGQNCSTSDGGMFPEMEKLKAELGL